MTKKSKCGDSSSFSDGLHIATYLVCTTFEERKPTCPANDLCTCSQGSGTSKINAYDPKKNVEVRKTRFCCNLVEICGLKRNFADCFPFRMAYVLFQLKRYSHTTTTESHFKLATRSQRFLISSAYLPSSKSAPCIYHHSSLARVRLG